MLSMSDVLGGAVQVLRVASASYPLSYCHDP